MVIVIKVELYLLVMIPRDRVGVVEKKCLASSMIHFLCISAQLRAHRSTFVVTR